MITYQILKGIFPGSDWLPAAIYLAVVSLLILRVKVDCKTLGESLTRHVILAILFPIIFAFCWLLIWPGALRLFLSGKRVADSTAAEVFRCNQQAKEGRLKPMANKSCEATGNNVSS